MANRSLAAKHDRAKRQMVALVQVEMSKTCYMTAKPEVPSYDVAMVRRVEPVTRKRKTVYRPSPVKTLVRAGIASCMTGDCSLRLIKRT
jgi:hypothetical protein